MTTRSPQPSLRPAHAAATLVALPPTLQPHAVLALAPPTDRARSVSVSAAIYAVIAGGVLWAAHAAPEVIKRVMPTGPIVLIAPMANPAPAHPFVKPATKPVADPTVKPPVTQQIPDTPPVLPTEDHSGDPPAPPAQPTGPSTTGQNASASGPISLSGESVRILHSVTPVYPPLAKMAHRQGEVVVRMTIDTAGVPTDVEAVSGQDVFTIPALQAARQWRFAPATQNGQAVPATFLLTLKFVLR